MRLLVSVLVILFLGFAPPAEAAGDEMSKERARSYYLESVCPHQDVVDRFNRNLFRGRPTVTVEEIKRRLPELRRDSARLAASFYRVARKMENSPRNWPQEIAGDVERFTDRSTDTGYYADLMAEADFARGFVRSYNNAVRTSKVGERIANRVTAYLNIGRLACDRR